MKEIQSTGNVSHHPAGFSLIKMLLLLNVSQDRTCGEKGHANAFYNWATWKAVIERTYLNTQQTGCEKDVLDISWIA